MSTGYRGKPFPGGEAAAWKAAEDFAAAPTTAGRQAVAERVGVTADTIRKRCRMYGIDVPKAVTPPSSTNSSNDPPDIAIGPAGPEKVDACTRARFAYRGRRGQ